MVVRTVQWLVERNKQHNNYVPYIRVLFPDGSKYQLPAVSVWTRDISLWMTELALPLNVPYLTYSVRLKPVSCSKINLPVLLQKIDHVIPLDTDYIVYKADTQEPRHHPIQVPGCHTLFMHSIPPSQVNPYTMVRMSGSTPSMGEWNVDKLPPSHQIAHGLSWTSISLQPFEEAHYKLLLKTEETSAVQGNEDRGYTWERLRVEKPFYNRSFYPLASANKVVYTNWGDLHQTSKEIPRLVATRYTPGYYFPMPRPTPITPMCQGARTSNAGLHESSDTSIGTDFTTGRHQELKYFEPVHPSDLKFEDEVLKVSVQLGGQDFNQNRNAMTGSGYIDDGHKIGVVEVVDDSVDSSTHVPANTPSDELIVDTDTHAESENIVDTGGHVETDTTTHSDEIVDTGTLVETDMNTQSEEILDGMAEYAENYSHSEVMDHLGESTMNTRIDQMENAVHTYSNSYSEDVIESEGVVKSEDVVKTEYVIDAGNIDAHIKTQNEDVVSSGNLGDKDDTAISAEIRQMKDTGVDTDDIVDIADIYIAIADVLDVSDIDIEFDADESICTADVDVGTNEVTGADVDINMDTGRKPNTFYCNRHQRVLMPDATNNGVYSNEDADPREVHTLEDQEYSGDVCTRGNNEYVSYTEEQILEHDGQGKGYYEQVNEYVEQVIESGYDSYIQEQMNEYNGQVNEYVEQVIGNSYDSYIQEQMNAYDEQGNRYDEHENEYDEQGNRYDEHENEYDENGYDEQRNGYDEQGNRYDEQRNGYDEHMNGYDERENEYDEHMNGYDERMNGYDEQVLGYVTQVIENGYDRFIQEQMNGYDEEGNDYDERVNGYGGQVNGYYELVNEYVEQVIGNGYDTYIQEQMNGYGGHVNGYDERENAYDERENEYGELENGYDGQMNGYDEQGNGYDERENGYGGQKNGYYEQVNEYVEQVIESGYDSYMREQMNEYAGHMNEYDEQGNGYGEEVNGYDEQANGFFEQVNEYVEQVIENGYDCYMQEQMHAYHGQAHEYDEQGNEYDEQGNEYDDQGSKYDDQGSEYDEQLIENDEALQESIGDPSKVMPSDDLIDLNNDAPHDDVPCDPDGYAQEQMIEHDESMEDIIVGGNHPMSAEGRVDRSRAIPYTPDECDAINCRICHEHKPADGELRDDAVVEQLVDIGASENVDAHDETSLDQTTTDDMAQRIKARKTDSRASTLSDIQDLIMDLQEIKRIAITDIQIFIHPPSEENISAKASSSSNASSKDMGSQTPDFNSACNLHKCDNDKSYDVPCCSYALQAHHSGVSCKSSGCGVDLQSQGADASDIGMKYARSDIGLQTDYPNIGPKLSCDVGLQSDTDLMEGCGIRLQPEASAEPSHERGLKEINLQLSGTNMYIKSSGSDLINLQICGSGISLGDIVLVSDDGTGTPNASEQSGSGISLGDIALESDSRTGTPIASDHSSISLSNIVLESDGWTGTPKSSRSDLIDLQNDSSVLSLKDIVLESDDGTASPMKSDMKSGLHASDVMADLEICGSGISLGGGSTISLGEIVLESDNWTGTPVTSRNALAMHEAHSDAQFEISCKDSASQTYEVDLTRKKSAIDVGLQTFCVGTSDYGLHSTQSDVQSEVSCKDSASQTYEVDLMRKKSATDVGLQTIDVGTGPETSASEVGLQTSDVGTGVVTSATEVSSQTSYQTDGVVQSEIGLQVDKGDLMTEATSSAVGVDTDGLVAAAPSNAVGVDTVDLVAEAAKVSLNAVGVQASSPDLSLKASGELLMGQSTGEFFEKFPDARMIVVHVTAAGERHVDMVELDHSDSLMEDPLDARMQECLRTRERFIE